MRSRCVWRLVSLFILILLVPLAEGQTAEERSPTARQYVEPAPWFPNVLAPYQAQPAPPLVLDNSQRLDSLIHDGKLELTVADALALALENNLDLAVQRYVPAIADTDVLRTSSGQAARGVQGALVPSGLTVRRALVLASARRVAAADWAVPGE